MTLVEGFEEQFKDFGDLLDIVGLSENHELGVSRGFEKEIQSRASKLAVVHLESIRVLFDSVIEVFGDALRINQWQ